MDAFLEKFDALPFPARREIMEKLKEAIKWRGWDAHRWSHAGDAVSDIAEIFSSNGLQIEEYT